MFVTKEFSFDSAHFLTNYYGKCERMHGHTYRLSVTLEGAVQSNGLVIDFVVLKRIVKKRVLDALDHCLLNDVLENPSAERIAVWIWGRLKNLQELLKEEMDDPNLTTEIKNLLQSKEEGALEKTAFDKTLRLH
ncbi:MAG TPA: 6-carboxytetrahydropterin synthase QueD, partial [Candidatus Gracilibacteria bacterium]|nr:6-carboxytetrahydropterin synthase QueD [Candidatus Gracilibacteria bacterium]